jgi:O-antigen/teichoic acid export membrane protein
LKNKIFSFIHNYKSFLFFSILKYFEYAITALLFFHLANKVSPIDYGSAASSFLIITYSSFLVIGINQVLVKWFSNTIDHQLSFFLIKYFVIYNILFSFLTFLIVYYLTENKYAIFVGLISSSRIIIDGMGTFFRVNEKPKLINYVNISSGLFFAMLYFLYVTNIETFFKTWCVSQFFSLTISLILLKKLNLFSELKFFKINDTNFFKWLNFNFYNLITDGIKLSLITLLGTLFNSIDRIFYINLFKLSPNELGNIQLADNISNLFNIGIGSFLFVVTPFLLRRIRENNYLIIELYNKSIFSMIFFIIVFLIFIFPLTSLINYLFPKYILIGYPLFFSLLYKLLNLGFFIPGLVSMINNIEGEYIKIGLFWLVLNSCFIFILSFFIFSSLVFYIIPVVNSLFLVILHFHYYFKFIKIIKIDQLISSKF